MSSPGSTCFPVAGTYESGANWMNSTTTGRTGLGSFIRSDEPIESIHRVFRRCNASNFRRDYKFLYGRKTCIRSTGSVSWAGKCYDKIWIGVHGKESVCMVTLRQDVDMSRVGAFYHRYCLNQQTMCSYAQAIVSEVECLPFDDNFREKFGSIEKPFGVVSVIPCTVHEGNEGSSSAEYDENKAINFLRDKMKSNLEFTFDETVQTAISAFQHLWIKELKAEDIWVTTAWTIDSGSEHMQLTERKEHLAMICGGDGHPTTRRPFVAGPPSGTPFGEFGITNSGTHFDFSKSLPDGSPFLKLGPTDYHGTSNSDVFKSLPCVGGEGGPTTVPSDVMYRPSGDSVVYFAPPEFSVPYYVPKAVMERG